MSGRSVLGRGVGALLPEQDLAEGDERFFMCDVDKIRPNPNQPRSYFDETKMAELTQSIRDRGVIQPLLVTKAKGNRYDLIAGERRLRAAKLAGRQEVPVVVMEKGSDNESLELALIENIQRHDLNPIEEATAYSRLIEEFHLTQEEVAQKVGRQRSTVANVLRLLHLPKAVQDDVTTAKLSEGHARVLLRLKDTPDRLLEVRNRILSEQLSVRETERLCRQAVRTKEGGGKKTPPREHSTDNLPAAYCQTLENQLTNHLATKTRIIQNGQRGKLEIEYFSSDDLDRLVSLLTR